MRRYALFGIALIGLTAGGCSSSSENPRPTLKDLQTRYDWAPTFKEGLRMAKEKGKPAVLLFYHSLCLPCRDLVLNVAADERAAKLLDHYVFVAVNISSDRAARDQFGVRRVPDVRYLSPEGRELDKMKDRSPEAVTNQLKLVLSEVEQAKKHE